MGVVLGPFSRAARGPDVGYTYGMGKILPTYVLLLILCVMVGGCLAPMPGGNAGSVPQSTITDSLLKGLDKVNEGLQKATQVSTQLATAQQQYEAAKTSAFQQADVNKNGKVDADERPLYYSLLAGALSTMLSGVVSKFQDKSQKENADDAHNRVDALRAELLAKLEAQPKP